jgi:hypothetical protein
MLTIAVRVMSAASRQLADRTSGHPPGSSPVSWIGSVGWPDGPRRPASLLVVTSRPSPTSDWPGSLIPLPSDRAAQPMAGHHDHTPGGRCVKVTPEFLVQIVASPSLSLAVVIGALHQTSASVH